MAELSLCMIVRDESEVLARCLESVAGVADELVIVDTGSLDGTVDIARSFGAKIGHFEWIDDFAAARNHSFGLATRPYILWLDADDVVLPEDRKKLIDLKPRLKKDAYWMRYDYDRDAFGNTTCLVERERIVRNTPDIRWRDPVHTYLHLGPGVTMESVDVTIHHRRTPRGIWQDLGRSLRILRGVIGRPEYARSPRIRYYLAREYQGNGRYEEAVRAYEELLAMPETGTGDRIHACEQLAECRLRLGAREPARVAALEARRLDPRRAEPCVLLGRIAEDEGDLERAVVWYERSLRPLPDTLVPLSPHAYTTVPATRLGVLWAKLGDPARAERYNEMALRWSPNDPLLHMTRRSLRRQSPPGRTEPGRPLAVLCAGKTFEAWNGETPDGPGIGGSQTAAVRLAEELVRLGWQVVVFCPCAGMEGAVRGVGYLDIGRFPEFAREHVLDVFIALRHADLLRVPVRALRRYLWVQDAAAPALEGDERLDAVVCVSPWQRSLFVEDPRVPGDRIVVLPNAIDPERFASRVRKRRNRLLYSSEPNRGLETVLDLFPRIRSRFPDAELHVFNDFGNWNLSILANGLDRKSREWRDSIKAKLGQPGVVFHGRVGQRELAVEMQRSEIWFYPTHFSETFCITALEAQRAGAVCVCSDLAALRTTVGNRGILIPGDPFSEEYRERALAEIFGLLEDRERLRRMRDRARRWARAQTWSRVAGEWVRMFREGI